MHNDEDRLMTASVNPSRQKIGADKASVDAQAGFANETIRPSKDGAVPSFDWQAYVKAHPYLTLGIAAGTGIMLAGLFKPRPGAKKRFAKTLGNNLVGASRRLEHRFENLAEKPVRVGTSVKTAASGIVTKALKFYLKRRLISAFTPGHKRRTWF